MAPAGGAVAGPHDALIAKHSADLWRAGVAGAPRHPHREQGQSARGQQGQLRPDADPPRHRQVDGLSRHRRRPARCRHQHDLCGEVSRQRLSRGGMQRAARHQLLPARLLQEADIEMRAAAIRRRRSPSRACAASRLRSVPRPTAMRAPASADVLQPRVVQVQTIIRPKSAMAPPAAPAQVASRAGIRSRCCGAACCTGTGAPASAVVQPAVPPPAAPQTVAKAPEPDLSSPPPQSSPALPTVFMELLPMPRPRPAKRAAGGGEARRSSDRRTCVAKRCGRTRRRTFRWRNSIPRRCRCRNPSPRSKQRRSASRSAARRAPQRHTHTRVSRKKPEESGLVTFLEETDDA